MADYVIVGAGSAGCVLAARLTEDPDVSVTLLEAGGRDSARNIGIPAAFGQLFRTADDWDYATEPEPGCEGRSLYWPRGKVLGGSSSINAMIYIRGNRLDYDGWRDAGCDGWGYDEVLPYFLRSEGSFRGSSAYHRGDGPLSVNRQRSPSPLSLAYVEAAVPAGRGRPAGRAPVLERQGVPGSGPASAQPLRRHRRVGDEGPHRTWPGGRG
jgi:choline dehydrogenase